MSTILQPVAASIKAHLAAISLTGSITVKAYTWAPRELDSVPAGVVEPPSFSRRGLDEPESQIGANDWILSYPVSLYVDASEASYAQTQLVEFVEAFIARINADPSLSNTVYDAVVSTGEPFLELSQESRPLLAYQTSVEVWKLATT